MFVHESMFAGGGSVLVGLVLALILAPVSVNAAPMDLSGVWRLELKQCLIGEADCQKRLRDSGENTRSINHQLPANLRASIPWFTGEAVLSRDFELEDAGSQSLALLVGGIGSVDTIRINGVVIGSTGDASGATEGRFASAWSAPRFYHVPRSLLREGNNRIEIHFWALDVKAGVHRGPVLIGSQHELRGAYLWRRFFFSDVFYGTVILLLVTTVAFVQVVLMKLPGEGFTFLMLAFVAYSVHSLYFIELPMEVPYLWFLKVQWIMRVLALVLTDRFFLQMRDVRSVVFNWTHGCLHACTTIAILFAADFESYFFWAMIAAVAMFFSHLMVVLVFGLIPPGANANRAAVAIYMPVTIVVELTYISDILLRLYFHNLPWFYHYVSLTNVIGFLLFYSYHLIAWKDRAHEYQLRLATERLQIARDVHDTVGSQITELLVQSESLEAKDVRAGHIKRLARSSLESLRDIVSLLKSSDSTQESLPEFIREYGDRLRSAGTFQVSMQIDPVDIPDETALHIKKIFSEWMTNVIRHSEPGRIHISCGNRRGRAFFLVVDDGRGISWRGEAKGSGLAHIRFRADQVGARVRSMRFRTGNVFLCTDLTLWP